MHAMTVSGRKLIGTSSVSGGGSGGSGGGGGNGGNGGNGGGRTKVLPSSSVEKE